MTRAMAAPQMDALDRLLQPEPPPPHHDEPEGVPFGAPAIGHNAPPGLAEGDILKAQLDDEIAELAALAAKVEEAMARLPEIKDAKTAGNYADSLGQVAAAIKKLDEKRKALKAPYAACVDIIDGVSKIHAGKFESADATMRGMVEEWMTSNPASQQIRGEYGTLLVRGERWTASVTDYSKLDLKTLRKFIKPEHLDAALKAFIKDGGREIKGAEIRKVVTVSVR